MKLLLGVFFCTGNIDFLFLWVDIRSGKCYYFARNKKSIRVEYQEISKEETK